MAAPLVAFRPDPELDAALAAYADELGVSPSVAARTLLSAALGVHGGQTAKNAALRAALKQAVWQVAARGRKALQAALETARTELESTFELDG